ncbi:MULTISPECIES: hypothetical protein [unclassified Agrobacterium]
MVGYIVEAPLRAAATAAIFSDRLSWGTSSIICLAFTAGHFHGREKRGYEVSVHMNPPHIEGYYFWQWSWDGTDFWPTAIICFALIFMVVGAPLDVDNWRVWAIS